MAVAYLIIPFQPALQSAPAFCGRSGVPSLSLAGLGGLSTPTIPSVSTDIRRNKGISLPSVKSPAVGSTPLPLLVLPAGLNVAQPAVTSPVIVTSAPSSPQAVTGLDGAKQNANPPSSQTSGNGAVNDPLSGWMEQKLPPSGVGWDLPLLPAQALEQDMPLPADGGCIPEDLQDVLLDGPDAGAVPSLPADAADCLLEELISGSVRENPGLFDGVPPVGEITKPAESVMPPQPLVEEMGQMVPPLQQQQGALGSPQPVLLAPAPIGFSLSPQQQPQQVTLEPWSPTLCPSPDDSPISPSSECCSPELAPAPDWQPGPAARRGARKPRPYDKPARGGARRQPLTEEERRERKKEQNKNAATRYRQKKKVEHDLVSGDQEMLEARNKVLRERVGALSRELNYLKQLMREVLRHKQVSA